MTSINGRLVKKVGSHAMLRFGLFVQLLAGIGLFVSWLMDFAYLREKSARDQLETLLEDKTRALFIVNQELKEKLETVKNQQLSLMQSEKMATLGTLSAGPPLLPLRINRHLLLGVPLRPSSLQIT